MKQVDRAYEFSPCRTELMAGFVIFDPRMTNSNRMHGRNFL